MTLFVKNYSNYRSNKCQINFKIKTKTRYTDAKDFDWQV